MINAVIPVCLEFDELVLSYNSFAVGIEIELETNYWFMLSLKLIFQLPDVGLQLR